MVEDVRRGRQARMPWRASRRKQAGSSPLDLAEWVGKNRQPGKVGRQSRQKEGRKEEGWFEHLLLGTVQTAAGWHGIESFAHEVAGYSLWPLARASCAMESYSCACPSKLLVPSALLAGPR